MNEWMMYAAIFGGIALGAVPGIAYDERVLGITCRRREHTMVRREQAATRVDTSSAIDTLTVPSLRQAGLLPH